MPPKKTPANPPPARDADEPAFEEALERLETIVEELEAGTLSLEESIARYEEGIGLSRRLTQTLDAAEKRIERLIEKDGETATEPMELEAESEPEARSESPPRKPARGGDVEELPF